MRRRRLACLLCVCMVLGMLPVNALAGEKYAVEVSNMASATEVSEEEVATEEPAIYYGDVDENGMVTASDALMILRHIVKLPEITDEAVLEAADVDRDGNITTSDALNVIYYVVQLRDNISDGGVVESETAKMSLVVNENVVYLNIDESDWHQFSARLTWDGNVEATSERDTYFYYEDIAAYGSQGSCVSNPENKDTAVGEFLAAGVYTYLSGDGSVYTGTIYTLTFDPEVYDVEVTLYDGIDGGSAVQTVIVNPTPEETATPEETVTPGPLDPAVPEGLAYEISDGAVTITGYSGEEAELTIPSEIEGYPVTGIGDRAFEGCSSLTSVTIPEGVTSIGFSAFGGCTSLTNVAIPSSVTNIGESAFWYCSSLTNVTIPSSVSSIGAGAFADCSSLTSVMISEGVTSIGDSAFSWCTSLTNVTIPSSVTNIGGQAFRNCTSLTSVTIPSSVTNIGSGVFSECRSLTSVTIPSSVTNIGECAFSECSSLTSVTIPSSVVSVGIEAFFGCNNLTNVFYTGSETEWNEILIEDGNESLLNATIHFDSPMPTDAPSDVPAPAPESDFTAKETDSGVSVEKYIGTDATVVVPAQIAGKPVTAIGANAFADTAVEEIVLPESVTSIGEKAFANCENLESILILGDEIEIAGDAFVGCGKLTIKCLKNSAAQQYAQEHGITCESLYYYGDVNMDGVVAATDALDILKDVVQLAPITDETARQLANIDGTGGITASDALCVLKVVVQLQAKEVYLGK